MENEVSFETMLILIFGTVTGVILSVVTVPTNRTVAALGFGVAVGMFMLFLYELALMV